MSQLKSLIVTDYELFFPITDLFENFTVYEYRNLSESGKIF